MLDKITVILKKEGLKFDAKEMFEFIRAALESREFSKFEFTKPVVGRRAVGSVIQHSYMLTPTCLVNFVN